MNKTGNKTRIYIGGNANVNLMKELINEFLEPSEYEITFDLDDADISVSEDGALDRDEIKRRLYKSLVKLTGEEQVWGALTGVRPVKLTGELIRDIGISDAKERLSSFYYVSDEKIDELVDIYKYQSQIFHEPKIHSQSLYIGIPFCPTRCLYCSFASNPEEHGLMEEYFAALKSELKYLKTKSEELELNTESIYIGGGTPTTLAPDELGELVKIICDYFPERKEFTVEAGRPDTITKEKLEILKSYNVDRICVNPQSMKKETLERIGRSHTPSDIVKAYDLAHETGFDNINSDIIAGLPGETPDDFEDTVHKVMALGASDITVHTLSVKRGSRLHEEDKAYHYGAKQDVREMLIRSERILKNSGYRPYYLYRQKNMAGSMENTGYAKDDKCCLYNVRVMDEHQNTLAAGAGAISKRYHPDRDLIVRVPNVTNVRDYIDRLDEMKERKDKEYFVED